MAGFAVNTGWDVVALTALAEGIVRTMGFQSPRSDQSAVCTLTCMVVECMHR